MIKCQALYEASVCCKIMYTAVPRIGPSIVPSPPTMVTNAISAVNRTLNTAPGWTWSWLIASSAPAAPQPAPGKLGRLPVIGHGADQAAVPGRRQEVLQPEQHNHGATAAGRGAIAA